MLQLMAIIGSFPASAGKLFGSAGGNVAGPRTSPRAAEDPQIKQIIGPLAPHNGRVGHWNTIKTSV